MLYAATPQQAALRTVSFGVKAPATVVRANKAGRYAAVLTSGGKMEGSNVTAPILVERFSFGWQAIDLLNFRCRLDSHDLGASVSAQLMRGMPKPQDDRPCRGVRRDSGAQADVESVRRLMRGPLVPAVAVSGNWAIGDWYGAGGGEQLYRRLDGRWKFVAGGGGALGVSEMHEYGVPRADWCKLEVYDATCRDNGHK
jgi:hypothetical protein